MPPEQHAELVAGVAARLSAVKLAAAVPKDQNVIALEHSTTVGDALKVRDPPRTRRRLGRVVAPRGWTGRAGGRPRAPCRDFGFYPTHGQAGALSPATAMHPRLITRMWAEQLYSQLPAVQASAAPLPPLVSARSSLHNPHRRSPARASSPRHWWWCRGWKTWTRAPRRRRRPPRR